MKKIKTYFDVCANCVNFTQYYTVKCFHNFETAGCGYCGVKNQIIKETEVRECFRRRNSKWCTDDEIKNAIKVINELKELM